MRGAVDVQLCIRIDASVSVTFIITPLLVSIMTHMTEPKKKKEKYTKGCGSKMNSFDIINGTPRTYEAWYN